MRTTRAYTTTPDAEADVAVVLTKISRPTRCAGTGSVPPETTDEPYAGSPQPIPPNPPNSPD